MEHKDLTEQIMMLVAGELTGPESEQLLEHIDSCGICGKEYRFQMELLADLKETNPEFNIEKILTDSRRELRRTIHAIPDKVSLADRIRDFFRSPFAIPSLTGAGGLAVGLIAGILFLGSPAKEHDPFLTNVSDGGDPQTRITNVMFNDRDMKDGNISFTFDAYKRITISGSPDDPGIQKLLTYSILNEKNPGTRLNSINLVNIKTCPYCGKEFTVPWRERNGKLTCSRTCGARYGRQRREEIKAMKAVKEEVDAV